MCGILAIQTNKDSKPLKYEDVEYTSPFELFFLFVSTVAVFSAIVFVLNRIVSIGLLKGTLAFVLAGIYFYILKKNKHYSGLSIKVKKSE